MSAWGISALCRASSRDRGHGLLRGKSRSALPILEG